jgi:hypothetical protein
MQKLSGNFSLPDNHYFSETFPKNQPEFAF